MSVGKGWVRFGLPSVRRHVLLVGVGSNGRVGCELEGASGGNVGGRGN
jgi:hypothetical protein